MNQSTHLPKRRAQLFAVLLGVVLHAAPVAAQSTEANLLFDEGRKAMAARDYPQAIIKLQQSQKLDPAVGTLLNLAECFSVLGRTASAWAAYRDAASLARATKQVDRERFASKKAQELEPTLSRLELSVTPEARVAGLRITRNDVEVPEALYGSPIPVDPGAQHVEASAPGYQLWKFDVDVTENGGRAQVVVPALTPEQPAAAPSAPSTAAPPPAVSPPPAAPSTPAPAEPTAPRPDTTWRTLGWTGLIGGAVMAGTGIYFYNDGRHKIDDANCPNQICVRGIGDKDLHDSGRAREKIGGALGIVGGALALTSAVLLLTDNGDESGRNDAASETSMHLQLRLAASAVQFSGVW